MINKQNIGKTPCGLHSPDQFNCNTNPCCMEDKTHIKYGYSEDLKPHVETFNHGGGPFASGIYEEANKKFPCGEILKDCLICWGKGCEVLPENNGLPSIRATPTLEQLCNYANVPVPSDEKIAKYLHTMRTGSTPPDRFPCGKTLSEGFACDSPECFEMGCIQTTALPLSTPGITITSKVLCAGCDADADCHACDGNSNASKNIEAAKNVQI